MEDCIPERNGPKGPTWKGLFKKIAKKTKRVVCMKRLFAVIIAMLLVFCVSGSAMADKTFADIGTEMQNTSAELFSMCFAMYPDGEGITDEAIDRMYEFQLYYLLGHVIYELEISHDSVYGWVKTQDMVNKSVSSWEELMKSLMNQHQKYMNGEMSKEAFTKLLYSISEAARKNSTY